MRQWMPLSFDPFIAVRTVPAAGHAPAGRAPRRERVLGDARQAA